MLPILKLQRRHVVADVRWFSQLSEDMIEVVPGARGLRS